MNEPGRGLGLEGGGRCVFGGQAGGQPVPLKAAMNAATDSLGLTPRHMASTRSSSGKARRRRSRPMCSSALTALTCWAARRRGDQDPNRRRVNGGVMRDRPDRRQAPGSTRVSRRGLPASACSPSISGRPMGTATDVRTCSHSAAALPANAVASSARSVSASRGPCAHASQGAKGAADGRPRLLAHGLFSRARAGFCRARRRLQAERLDPPSGCCTPAGRRRYGRILGDPGCIAELAGRGLVTIGG